MPRIRVIEVGLVDTKGYRYRLEEWEGDMPDRYDSTYVRGRRDPATEWAKRAVAMLWNAENTDQDGERHVFPASKTGEARYILVADDKPEFNEYGEVSP